MKKIKRVLILTIMIILFVATNNVFAVDTTKIKEYIEAKGLKANTITASDILTMYQDLSKDYTNAEISEMLEEYSEELTGAGISNEAISTAKRILNTTDSGTLNKIFEDLNIEEIKEKLNYGATAEEIVRDVNDNMSTKQKFSILSKVVLGNNILKNVFIIFIVYSIYMILVRGKIYQKSGEHYWATFIPFYRDIVLFKICGYSAWWLLLLLVPIIGWIIYGILKIIMNFELSTAFGKNALFGIGLWIFKPIFESLVAFSDKCKYIEFE